MEWDWLLSPGLVVPGLVALAIGAIAARRLPVLGLVVVLALILCLALSRLAFGLTSPSLLETILLVALVQAGYLGSVLWPSADRAEKSTHHSLGKDSGTR